MSLPTALSFGRCASGTSGIAAVLFRLRGLLANETFDDAILERVKADDAQPTVTAKDVDALLQCAPELFQFVVDEDADRLERLRRRVDLLLPMRGCGRGDDARQLQSRAQIGDSLRAATIAAALCVAACRSSPYCFRTRLNSFSSTVASHSCGADTRFRVHAHVERTVAQEAEAATWLIQLWRRDADRSRSSSVHGSCEIPLVNECLKLRT